MKTVICKSKEGLLWDTNSIVIGEKYTVINEAHKDGGLFYTIKTKYGSIGWISSNNFIEIDEHRNNQIEDLIGK